MIDLKTYVVTREIALQIGDLETKYRTADGCFIVDSRMLKGAGISPDADGVEEVSKAIAKELIRKGGYQRGDIEEDEATVQEQAAVADEVEETENVNENETEEDGTDNQ